MDDNYIKNLISSYQLTGEGFPVILEHLSLFIYYFPKLVSNYCKEDIFGEYYDYLLERLPKILCSYTPMQNSLFKTWFYIVQKRHYLNFLKMYQRPTLENSCEYMESFSLDIAGGTQVLNSDFLSTLSPHMTNEELLFLKLFTPDNLNKEDFKYLMDMLDCDMETLMLRLRLLFDYIGTYDGKKLIKLVPVNKVADFLGWNRLKVSKKLNKIRQKMQKTYIWED